MASKFIEKTSKKHPGISIREYDNGSTKYYVRVRLKGQKSQSASFDRLTDARKWKQATEAAMREGRHFPSSISKKRTVADLIDRYIANVIPHKTGDAKQKKNQTNQLLWWKDQIGHVVLAELSPPLLIETRDILLNTAGPKGKPRSGATANRYCAILSHALTVATNEWEWLQDNPFRKIKKFSETRGRTRFLSDEERVALLEQTSKETNSYVHIVTVTAISTGARLGEIMNLAWKDVDLANGALTFHQTKNGESRKVPLTGYALELMYEHSKIRRIDTPLVFPNRKGNKPSEIWDAFYRARDAAGIEDFHFHDLRHTAASYLAMNGASLAEIADVLGHKTLQMVKRYAHLSPAHTTKVVASMNERVFYGKNPR